MSIIWVHDDEMTEIANALRTKLKTDIPYAPSQMHTALNALEIVKNDLQSFLDKSITVYESDIPTRVRAYSFAYCQKLHTVTLNNVTDMADHAFYACRDLKHISFNNLKNIGESCFSGCERLETIILPKAITIGNYGFYSCIRLMHIYLTYDSMCTLAHSDALLGTPIANGKGFIHVPSSLVSTYQNDPVWSTYASQIIAIT